MSIEIDVRKPVEATCYQVKFTDTDKVEFLIYVSEQQLENMRFQIDQILFANQMEISEFEEYQKGLIEELALSEHLLGDYN